MISYKQIIDFIKLMLLFLITSVLLISNVYSAQTLDDAINLQLANGCSLLTNNIASPPLGSNLFSVCIAANQLAGGMGGNGIPSPVATGGGSSTTAVASSILKRLHKDALGEENQQEGAASSDGSVELTKGIDLFFSSSYEVLDRDNTRFESGYDSDIWRGAVGLDFELASWLRTGVAFNYSHWDADFSSRGGFKTDSYGPVLFASFNPSDQFFADIVLNYAHKEYERHRFTQFTDFGVLLTRGNVSSDSESDEFGAMVSTGYDFIFGNFTVGPRIGFQYNHLAIDGYTEKGNTGLELKYTDDSVDSLKTTLGIRGSAAFSTNFGVLLPEINAEWVHEFMNDQRNIVVKFAQDHRVNPSKFSYNNESPDRDYFHVGAGLSILLAHGIQPYINFQALVGHSYHTNYVGTIGGRIEF